MKPRVHQLDAFDSTCKYIKEKPGKCPVIVLPTGSGKTLVIAMLVKYFAKHKKKVVILSHVKEILEQNHAAIVAHTGLNIGINSSMLGRREVKDITVAGIQSVFRCASKFNHHDYIIIDEAHLISVEEGTMYETFFRNSGIKTKIGLTATPYRLGTGLIYGKSEYAVFDDVCCNWGSMDKFNELIELGYLCKLTTKRTEAEMDTSGIKMVAGDFNEKQLSDRFDRTNITTAIVKEIMAAGQNRNKWLIFAIDINHAEHIAEILIRNGISTAPIHSKMHESGFDRVNTLDKLKAGGYRAAVNVNILTTGFDDPEIDLIAVVRPTSSPVLHVQLNGRGSRVCEGKKDCLVLDFAGNTDRLGPINNPLIVIKGKGKGGGEPITKTCPVCSSIVHPSVRRCPDCDHKFSFEHGLYLSSTNNEIIEDGKAHWIMVDRVSYEVDARIAAPSNLKVSYHCGKKVINEWVCVEHKGFAKHKADHWVKFRGGKPCSTAIELHRESANLAVARKILVQKKGKYYSVNDVLFIE